MQDVQPTRIRHFKEYLESVQGNDSIVIPAKIIEGIKTRYSNGSVLQERDSLGVDIVIRYLKETGNNKYCGNVHKILKLCESPNICKFTEIEIEMLIEDFKAIDGAFSEISPEIYPRTGFFPLQYLLPKMCEMRNITIPDRAFKPFRLEKTMHLERVWKAVCQRLGSDWKYIPTKLTPR